MGTTAKKPEDKKTSAEQKQPVDSPKKVKKTLKKLKTKTRGKKYTQAKIKIAAQKLYPLKQAISLLKEVSFENFDASVEVHINTNEKNLKGEATLPNGTGKTLKITVFDEKVEAQIKDNKIDFDILVALPKDMVKLVKYAKVLGPKGLMPSPKKGTLTEDPKKAIAKLTSGSIMYKTESKFPLIHQIVGKKSFSEKQLIENITALFIAIGRKNIEALFVKTTMSPSVSVDLNSF